MPNPRTINVASKRARSGDGTLEYWVHELGWLQDRLDKQLAEFLADVLGALANPAEECLLCGYAGVSGSLPEVEPLVTRVFERGLLFKERVQWAATKVRLNSQLLSSLWPLEQNETTLVVAGDLDVAARVLREAYVDDVEANPDNELMLLARTRSAHVASRGWDGMTLRIYTTQHDAEAVFEAAKRSVPRDCNWTIEKADQLLG